MFMWKKSAMVLMPGLLIAAQTAAIMDFRPGLRPGERASILCLAVDRAQTLIVHRYVRGYFDQIPLLKPLVDIPRTWCHRPDRCNRCDRCDGRAGTEG